LATTGSRIAAVGSVPADKGQRKPAVAAVATEVSAIAAVLTWAAVAAVL
jgi:hypothetical protein